VAAKDPSARSIEVARRHTWRNAVHHRLAGLSNDPSGPNECIKFFLVLNRHESIVGLNAIAACW